MFIFGQVLDIPHWNISHSKSPCTQCGIVSSHSLIHSWHFAHSGLGAHDSFLFFFMCRIELRHLRVLGIGRSSYTNKRLRLPHRNEPSFASCSSYPLTKDILYLLLVFSCFILRAIYIHWNTSKQVFFEFRTILYASDFFMQIGRELIYC